MKKIISLIIVAAMLFSLSSCSLVLFNTYEQMEPLRAEDLTPIDKLVYIDREKSSFSEAQRADGEVVYICKVAVCNESSKEKAISFIADFEQEYDMGIIDGIYLSGETETGTEVFSVPAESEEIYTVYFRGKICEGYEGKELKYDRCLPEIEMNVKDIGE